MMSNAIEQYLRGIVALADDAPLLHELASDDIGTERGTASIARAALVHLLERKPQAIANRVREELADVDLYLRYRFAEGSHDVSQGFHTQAFGELILDTPQRRIAWYEANARRLASQMMFVDPDGVTPHG